MNARDVVVVGCSSGGIGALQMLVQGLPVDYAASIFVVQHLSPGFPTTLPAILQRAGKLRAKHPTNHEAIEKSCIYVAPPDRHMLIQDGHVCTSRGPRENHVRPAVDALFRSAALVYGPRVVGVVLTGNLDDGTAGLLAIKNRGGIAVVQHPKDAAYPSMPTSALQYVKIDHCVPLAEIPSLLVSLANDPVEEMSDHTMLRSIEVENRIAMNDPEAIKDIESLGDLSTVTCPDCQGVMWKLRENEFHRFRCLTGHAHTCSSLMVEQSQAIDHFLEEARRLSKEQLVVSKYLSKQASESADMETGAWVAAQLKEAERREALLQQTLPNGNEVLASELLSVS